MKTKLTHHLLAALLGVAFAVNLHAQTTAFTYQGFLTANGAPANGTNDFEFKLYNDPTSGAQQGSTVTKGDVAVTNGLFTVTLDFTGTPFTGQALWLDIAVRPGASVGAYTNLVPRQPITATPYATRAANAANAASAVAVSGPVAASQLTGTISSNNIGTGSITTVMLADGAVGTAQLADEAVTSDKILSTSDWFLTQSIFNPTPQNSDEFGFSAAGVGTDQVLIGAYADDTGAADAGSAYLFSTDGTLLTTFTNPTPQNSDLFGWSVAGVGTDRVLIGARKDNTGATAAGSAYLFSTDGTLLTTFTNPTPQNYEYFGWSVAGVGTDHVLIGVPWDETGTTNAGAAYLFSTNGTLLNAFTNPTPQSGGGFGNAVAGLGTDKVLIGAANVGAAYLYSTNGTVLTTLTIPTLQSNASFGYSVAGVGTDKVLIGAGAEITAAGAAYLFSTDGTLLNTFTNPTPQINDHFGGAVAGVGTDKVLIGANRDNTGATAAGAAYLYETHSYAPGLVADGVAPNSITSLEIADAAIGDTKLATISTPGKVADSALSPNVSLMGASIESSEITDGTVTAADLSASLTNGLWSGDGTNVFRASGNAGIGTDNPQDVLHVLGNGGIRVRSESAGTFYAGFLSKNSQAEWFMGIDPFSGFGAWTLYQNGPSPGGIRMMVGTNGNVGIGTNNPTHSLTILSSTDDNALRLIGPSGPFGYGARLNFGDANFVYLHEYVDDSLRIQATRIGIGRSASTNRLEVEGDASKTAAGSWLANSDQRIKQDVQTVTDALSTLEKVRLVSFRYTDDYRQAHPSVEDHPYLNVIAQEFREVFPESVKSSGDKLPDGSEILQVDTYPLTIYSAAAIQELNEKLNQKETQITELKRKNEALEARLEKLEQLFNENLNGGVK